jgi:hypothetical protein
MTAIVVGQTSGQWVYPKKTTRVRSLSSESETCSPRCVRSEKSGAEIGEGRK